MLQTPERTHRSDQAGRYGSDGTFSCDSSIVNRVFPFWLERRYHLPLSLHPRLPSKQTNAWGLAASDQASAAQPMASLTASDLAATASATGLLSAVYSLWSREQSISVGAGRGAIRAFHGRRLLLIPYGGVPNESTICAISSLENHMHGVRSGLGRVPPKSELPHVGRVSPLSLVSRSIRFSPVAWRLIDPSAVPESLFTFLARRSFTCQRPFSGANGTRIKMHVSTSLQQLQALPDGLLTISGDWLWNVKSVDACSRRPVRSRKRC